MIKKLSLFIQIVEVDESCEDNDEETFPFSMVTLVAISFDEWSTFISVVLNSEDIIDEVKENILLF